MGNSADWWARAQRFDSPSIYGWFDQAAVTNSTFDKATWDSNQLYNSGQYYDGIGRLQRATIVDGKPRSVHFALNAEGQVLSRVQNDGSSDDPRDYHLFVDGKQVGEYTNNYKEDVRDYDYLQMINLRTSTANGSGDFFQGATTGFVGGEFGTSGYDPINPTTTGTTQAGRSRYTVRSGDTLEGIARQLWGDGALWYRLAEAKPFRRQPARSPMPRSNHDPRMRSP